MMKSFFSGKELWRIIGKDNSNIKKLGRELNVKINIDKQGNIEIKSIKNDSFIEYIALKIIDALALGFEIETALLLKDEKYSLVKINIHSYVKESRQKEVTGIVIGTKGMTKRIIEELSECEIVIAEHNIGIIGKNENAELANEAIIMLLRGAKQAAVYRFLEKSQPRIKAIHEEQVEELIKKD